MTDVLIANHSPEEQGNIMAVVKKIGPELRAKCVSSGIELLREMSAYAQHRQDPPLVLIDLDIDAQNGLKLLAELSHQQLLHIPVIALSSQRSFEEKIQVIQLGAEGYYAKPKGFGEQLLIIGKILRRWLPQQTDFHTLYRFHSGITHS